MQPEEPNQIKESDQSEEEEEADEEEEVKQGYDILKVEELSPAEFTMCMTNSHVLPV